MTSTYNEQEKKMMYIGELYTDCFTGTDRIWAGSNGYQTYNEINPSSLLKAWRTRRLENLDTVNRLDTVGNILKNI